MRVTSLQQLPPSCAINISCPAVPEDMANPEVMGNYVATSHYCWGRVVFKHVDRRLVLVVNDRGVWVVRYVFDEEEFIWGPYHVGTCPSQIAQDEWDYRTTDDDDDDDGWLTTRHFPKLVIKCLKH